MPDSPGSLLLAYCVAIALASLCGGLLPNLVRMTHTRTQLAMSLVSGLMLGVAFFHLLPHSIVMRPTANAIDFSVGWLLAGLVVMLLLLRTFHFHQHEFEDGAPVHAVGHVHAHGHEAALHPLESATAHRLSWVGIALGLGLHTVIDGVALGAAMRGAGVLQGSGLLGVGVFFAILLHKPLDAMSITAIMQGGGWSRGAMRAVNLAFATLCPLGALLFFFGVDSLAFAERDVVAAALAFSAGAFICIALSDLLPEVHFHSHDRVKLTAVFLLGIAIAYAIGDLEPGDAHQRHYEAVQARDHLPAVPQR